MTCPQRAENRAPPSRPGRGELAGLPVHFPLLGITAAPLRLVDQVTVVVHLRVLSARISRMNSRKGVFPRCSRRSAHGTMRTMGAVEVQIVQVRLLGPFSVSVGGQTAGPWPRPSAKRLCARVLVAPGRRISR